MPFQPRGRLEVYSHRFYMSNMQMTVRLRRKSESFDTICYLQMLFINLFCVALLLEDSWLYASYFIPEMVVSFCYIVNSFNLILGLFTYRPLVTNFWDFIKDILTVNSYELIPHLFAYLADTTQDIMPFCLKLFLLFLDNLFKLLLKNAWLIYLLFLHLRKKLINLWLSDLFIVFDSSS